MKIADYAQGRNNNFNFIRALAAYMVLVSHCFPLALGEGGVDPLEKILGMSMGVIAVDSFFVISGFLVTASLLDKNNIIKFSIARALRILPALLVVVLIAAFIVGVYFTVHPLSVYFSSGEVYKYIIKNSLILDGMAFNLPGVFIDNPYKYSVNGSLWTITYEVKMYIVLAFIWFLANKANCNNEKLFLRSVLVVCLVSGVVYLLSGFDVIESKSKSIRFIFWFFSGASYFLLKDKIILNKNILLLVLAVFSVVFVGCKPYFFVAYTLMLPLLLLSLAYVPTLLTFYNNVGDYSYGIYIYAFLVQQSIAALMPGVSVGGMVILSTVFTVFFAVLSWVFVEKHALLLKKKLLVPV